MDLSADYARPARRAPVPRSQAIAKTWANLDWPSAFSAVIYPVLGVLALIGVVIAGVALPQVTLHWWYAPVAFGAGALTLVLCNLGIGGLHRVWQHRAGEMRGIAQVMTAVNCVLAMQGQLRDWVNYHSQHHRLSDKPGDPHNPAEGQFWAWIGWLLWRDKNDLGKPLALWLRENRVVRVTDRFYISLTVVAHLVVPALIYLAVWMLGGSLVLTALIHAAAVIGRGLQFHATVYGVNVVGHLKTPAWVDWTLAILTGGEALHDHHHEDPKSALHLPRRGLVNRLVDYNGTMLLIWEKLGLARNLSIAPRYAG